MYRSTLFTSELAIDPNAGTKRFVARDKLILDLQTIWSIEEGVVKTTTWNEDGVSIILGYWGQGDVIGYPLTRVQPYYIECLTPVRISRVPLDSPRLIKALVTNSQHNEFFIDILHQPRVRCRLVGLLKWLAHRFGYPTERGNLLSLQLTHQDIADTICATRVTITRLISTLEQEGQIERAGRQIIVKA